MRHTLLCRLTRYADADAVFERLLPHAAGDVAATASAFAPQIEALSARQRHAQAGELALECLRRLGIEVPPEGAWPSALQAETDALYQALAAAGERLYDTLPDSREPIVEATGRVLNAVPPGGEWRLEVRHWAILRGLRLGGERGRHPALAWSLSMATRRCLNSLAGWSR